MADPKRDSTKSFGVQRERALLMGVIIPGWMGNTADPLGELRALTSTAGAIIVAEMTAKRKTIHPGLYIGSGKAQEIAERCELEDVDTVIFDNDLSPAQIRDLEEIIERKVIDRSELILDIFAAHARTSESRLQVELAQLEYTYPRLTRMWTHLERLAGGASSAAAAVGGIGTRGPGEKQLEIDRRLVQKRVSRLKDKIAQIDRRKIREVKSRKDIFSVCLVGYTNAGKSTLMKHLTGENVYIADQLFATLEARTAKWKPTGTGGTGQDVLLSDTVGFVRDLPHHLVASFRATLEVAVGADLLIHVADASNEHIVSQIEAVQEVLEEIGCEQNKSLLVLNKTDMLEDISVRQVLESQFPDAIFLSASTGDGTDALCDYVIRESTGTPIYVSLKADCSNGKLMQYIARFAEIKTQTFEGQFASITATIPQKKLQPLLDAGAFNGAVEIISYGEDPL